MLIAVIAGVVALVVAAVIAARAAKAEMLRAASSAIDDARMQTAAEIKAAQLEATAKAKEMETAARSEALDAIAKADDAMAADEARATKREDELDKKRDEVAQVLDAVEQREAQLAQVQKDVQSRFDRARGVDQDIQRKRSSWRGELEKRAGVAGSELITLMTREWVEQAKAKAAAQIRVAEQNTTDPQHDREAKRVMEIAASRCSMHFLTERNLSTLRVGPDIVSILLDNNAAIHTALEKVAGVQLQINDDRDVVRLEGLDGVGREVVRRALARMIKKPETIDNARRSPDEWATKAREHLEQEIRALGKKAFSALGIPKAHPEIVELVGALNFRTSYTQNQWLHAVEASYLAGMMAAELGLDEKLARRATLMHDIGKALTHKIEGSHAVIGAEIARRLGESELVANAIGSHHADEPANSVYAYLVAASDAMSGARPGARREQTEGFSTKVEDLERIGMQRRGVVHAHAVHGGRELRVYVRERDVDDLAVVEMSTEIANQIAEELTFPGQIKVTVIRAFEATSTAN
ncbi:MAG TPA: Rnase Y domain-containing protein [Kofleriaceae bacterium]|nr:Rnase Y domain-containing protein [Kofleriaceae bacterium]